MRLLTHSGSNITHYKRIYDMLIYSIVCICVLIIYQVDIGFIYHYVKSQSVIKLFAFYNALEVRHSTPVMHTHHADGGQTPCGSFNRHV